MKKWAFHYILFQVFFSLLAWVPIFYEYQKRLGLTDSQIFAIQSFYYWFFCLLEIPTGSFADRFGAPLSMRVGALLLVVANCIAVVWTTPVGFGMHFFLVAASRSFISGASSMHAYHHALADGNPEGFKKVEGDARAWGLVAKVFVWAGVGILFQWDIRLPYALTILTSLVALAIALGMREARSAERPVEKLQFKRLVTLLFEEPKLKWLIGQGMPVFVLSRLIQVNLFQPLLSAKDWNIAGHGAVMAAMTIFEALGSWMVRSISARIEIPAALGWLNLGICVFSIAAPATNHFLLVVVLCAFSFCVGVATPLQRQAVLDNFRSSTLQATILSTESLVDRGIIALFVPLMGGFVSSGKLAELCTVIGIIIGVGAFVSQLKLMRGGERCAD